MSIDINLPLIGHIVVLSDEQKAIVDKALADAGHSLVAFAGNEISILWAETKAKFPDLVAAIKKGIADIESSSLSGGDKALHVVADVISAVPPVLAAIPDLKAFLMHGVTEVYAAGVKELESGAAALIGKL